MYSFLEAVSPFVRVTSFLLVLVGLGAASAGSTTTRLANIMSGRGRADVTNTPETAPTENAFALAMHRIAFRSWVAGIASRVTIICGVLITVLPNWLQKPYLVLGPIVITQFVLGILIFSLAIPISINVSRFRLILDTFSDGDFTYFVTLFSNGFVRLVYGWSLICASLALFGLGWMVRDEFSTG
ncbi:hypothetical protein F4859DRAFT_523065 [Xylaria cf. heliscus]|nr:hypothetical protein F4859DRAFT_523065 [Xylaria cf. heliscus]